MKLIAPNYYTSFKCTAGACKHSCCIGWEIDIDEQSLLRYKSISGDFGKRLEENITYDDSCAHFALDQNERCPFLNSEGLCDIILTYGEDAICQICSDHPRFRNFFSSRTEVGLGLCCEAAAKLILTFPEKVRLEEADDGIPSDIPDYERHFLDFRNKVFDILQNRSESIDARVERMLTACGAKLAQKSLSEWYEIFRSLERLDPVWDGILAKLNSPSIPPANANEFEVAFEQLLVYLVYRHLSASYDDGRVPERASFIALSFHIIRSLFYAADLNNMESLIELSRLYSSEIEYSEDNISTLLDILEQ